MLRVGSWLYNRKGPASVSTQSLDSLSESRQLEDALRAATLIMDDDVDGAEEGLQKGNSSFHKLGKGVVAFIRATLGFEQDIMRQASERLADAETSSSHDQHKATHNANAQNAYRSSIYAPGTEYILCQSMAQLMAAVVGVLNESLAESIKAFYKLRKAYIALDGIMQMEEKYLQSRSSRDPSSSTTSLSNSAQGDGQPENSKTKVSGVSSGEESPLSHSSHEPRKETPQSDGNMGAVSDVIAARRSLSIDIDALDLSDNDALPKLKIETSRTSNHVDSDIFSNPVDAFVHSGANLCFGLLLLLISMVPPAFNKLLYIVGFRGDRSRGLRMLWQATKFHNLNGAIAGLGLLAFYNGFIRFCEILPDEGTPNGSEVDSYPGKRLETLLSEMRVRFPRSQLWLLEESRMHSANRKLDEALNLLMSSKKSPLKQVEALIVFEKSLDAMYLHNYTLCADSFIECVDLNSWSRALYYYIAASSYVSLYRQNAQSSPDLAKEYASKATELFRKAPAHAGKKRFMARQLPFDIFVTRKISKWDARAKDWNVDFIDAIGVDPIEEMIFFWNGHTRMTQEQLDQSLKNLAWSESKENKTWHRESADEKAILALLRAAVYRTLRRHDEAKELLQSQILVHDKATFKGHLKDDWTCPTAHYEMAANLWMERRKYPQPSTPVDVPAKNAPSRSGSPESANDSPQSTTASSKAGQPAENDSHESDEKHDRRKVLECKEYLDKVSKWESYDLDARVGLKITIAEETVRDYLAADS